MKEFVLAMQPRRSDSQRWEVGAYFAVPLSYGYGFGRIIDPNAVGIYELLSVAPVAPSVLDDAPMLFFCHIDKSPIILGEWSVIGHKALEDRLVGVVKFALQVPGVVEVRRWISSSLHEREVPAAEALGLEWYRRHDAALVQQRIENHMFLGWPCPIKAALTFDSNRIPPPPPARPRRRRKPEVIDIFDDDAAAVWTNELIEGDSVEPIAAAFRDVLDEEWIVDTDVAASAVAAGEVLAAAKGRPGLGMPSHLPPWIERWRNSILELKLEIVAEQALRRVRDGSELSGRWSEAGMRQIFARMIGDLLARLR